MMFVCQTKQSWVNNYYSQMCRLSCHRSLKFTDYMPYPLCGGVRDLFTKRRFPINDTKLHLLLRLRIWRVSSTLSLPLLSGPLWHQSGSTRTWDLFMRSNRSNYSYSIGPCAKRIRIVCKTNSYSIGPCAKIPRNKYTKYVNMNAIS